MNDTNKLSNEKIQEVISMQDKPPLINTCISTQISGMDPAKVKGAVASVLSSNPNIAMSVANQLIVQSINLPPEQMKGAIQNAMNEPGARLVVIRGLLNMDKIPATDAPI